ncbi:MAG: class I SAM-dependent methyltransferase [Porticoccaceae bacterium]
MSNQHIIHHFGLKILRSTHPEVRKIKRKQQGHSAHGNKVWRSSFALIDYLETYPIEAHSKVLEIGCGWGLSGLYAAKNQQADVTGIDIDASVQPYFALQNAINDSVVKFQQRSFESLTTEELNQYQYIIGSDICFWDEMTDPLFDLIERAIKSGVKKILIADPGRPPFWELGDRCAQRLNSEIITRRIYQPFKSEKYILAITNQ